METVNDIIASIITEGYLSAKEDTCPYDTSDTATYTQHIYARLWKHGRRFRENNEPLPEAYKTRFEDVEKDVTS